MGVGAEHALQRRGQSLQELKALGNLYGLRSAFGSAVAVSVPPITRNHLNAGVVFQPLRQRARFPVLQQRHRPMPFHIHQHGAIALASAKGEIIHAKSGWGGGWRPRYPAHRPSERIMTDTQAKVLTQPFTSLPPQRDSKGGPLLS